MSIDVKKKSTIILRDSSGNLFQALPETKADYVSYGETNAATELARQADYDVHESSVEVESFTSSETEEVHLEHTGTITNSSDSPGNTLKISFSINFGGQDIRAASGEVVDEILSPVSVSNSIHNGNDLWLGYFYDENNVVLGESSEYYNDGVLSVSSNKPYYYNFTLDSNFAVNGIQAMVSGCSFYDENNNNKGYGDTILIAGSSYTGRDGPIFALETEYVSYNDNNNPLDFGIQFALPEAGESETLYFNVWQDYSNGYYTIEEGVIDEQNISLTIEHVSENNYRLCFRWDTETDETITNTTNWKELKTTIEREDGTEAAVSKPISGLLQDLSGSVEEKIETVSETESLDGKEYRSLVRIAYDDGNNDNP